MTTRAHYWGDVNPEYGGYFYDSTNFCWGYSMVVRITPCSDAGGPDNCWWIDVLTVNFPDDDSERYAILDACGIELRQLTPFQRNCAMVDACLSYGKYDQDSSTMVRIGAPDPFYSGREGPFNPDKILRGNASIRAYAHKLFHEVA
jgi:hypothetical protein